ncbi:PAP/25A-associated [Macleaya cordata]|uniref:PAP/25A-associated n=1 Tax=Macleaya cordata TaxID=56857 RepID=A0A200QYP1_MACCD|nr:PAP/25A-associated [Macleaya cordata]
MSSFYTNDTLERCLRDILDVIKPLLGDVTTRYQIINEFKAVVESVESLRGATVEPFGSFVSNLYTRWGDLDISIEIPCGSLVSSAGKKSKQKFLRDVLKVLRSRGGVRNLEFIPNARVPLLIFVSNHQNISCDISISNLLGQIKSKFLLWITQIDERFRDMVLLIKEWAKSQQINDPKTGTLNSYSLCMLVIFHFQTCEPAILPPLHEIYAGNIVDDLTGSRVTAERNIQDTCTANIERYKRNRFGNVNKSSLSELFISFFQKFSRINMMALEQAICTYTGRWEHKRSNAKWTKTYPLLVEDPFERPENAARAVSMRQLIKISEAFERTYFKLVSSRDRNLLISSLVRPHISSELNTGTPHGNPISLHGGSGRYPPLLSRAVPPVQNQVRNMRYETNPSPMRYETNRYETNPSPMRYETNPSPSVPSRRPGSATHVQGGQQVWKPKYSAR